MSWTAEFDDTFRKAEDIGTGSLGFGSDVLSQMIGKYFAEWTASKVVF